MSQSMTGHVLLCTLPSDVRMPQNVHVSVHGQCVCAEFRYDGFDSLWLRVLNGALRSQTGAQGHVGSDMS